MKDRITTGWNAQRVIQLVLGTGLLLYSVYSSIWLGAFLGVYISLMSILNMGCAGASCYTGSVSDPSGARDQYISKEVTFEEVRSDS